MLSEGSSGLAPAQWEWPGFAGVRRRSQASSTNAVVVVVVDAVVMGVVVVKSL